MVKPMYRYDVILLGHVYVEKNGFLALGSEKGTSSLHREMEKAF
jgi:hypothetical protein